MSATYTSRVRTGFLARERDHLGGDVARGDVEATFEQGQEALAGAAADVEDSDDRGARTRRAARSMAPSHGP